MSTLEKSATNICWICIFQTLNPFCCYLGVFAQNVSFIKNYSFSKNFFETNLDLRKHLQKVFVDLFQIFQWALCQILELLDQNPWRYNLSKLATFNSIFQLTHSALGIFGESLDGCQPLWVDVKGLADVVKSTENVFRLGLVVKPENLNLKDNCLLNLVKTAYLCLWMISTAKRCS